ncbi:MAG: peptidoglycan DD-metalloendopeptidase family protein [Bacteroidales bacterium]|nr:peptidoglycan DD-metalloendopeptidase family protein [Bacteroidales bacterium]
MRKILIGILALLLLAAPAPAQKKKASKATSSQSQSVKNLKSQREKTLKELEETKKMIQQTNSNEKATVNKLNLLNKDIQTRKRLIHDLNYEIQGLDQEMTRLSMKRDSLQADLEALKESYAELVRQSHYTIADESPLLFILSAEDFQQMLRRVRYMQEFQQFRKEQVARIENTQAEIDMQNQMLSENKSNKEEAVRTHKVQQDNLSRDEKKQKAMLEQLKKKKSTLLAQQKKQQKKADDLNRKIEELIAKEMSKSEGKTLTKEQTLIAGGFEKNKGRLPMPVEKGFISGHFGVQAHPTLEKVTVNNKGVYIQTSAGTQARAVYEGEVTSCFVMSGTTAVIIQHGNYRTVYSGLYSVSVKKGDKVKAKQAIGTIYSDPEDDNATTLFFQIWLNKNILNPEQWLAK